MNWAGLTFAAGATVVLDVNGPADAVPEPSIWTLILIGFAGLSMAGYCRSDNSRAVLAD